MPVGHVFENHRVNAENVCNEFIERFEIFVILHFSNIINGDFHFVDRILIAILCISNEALSRGRRLIDSTYFLNSLEKSKIHKNLF